MVDASRASGHAGAPAVDAKLVADLERRAQWEREETVRLIAIAKTGHYASSFSCAEILVTLYFGGVMRLRAGEPDWPDRDRFLFGKGHAAAALYPILVELGFLEQTSSTDTRDWAIRSATTPIRRGCRASISASGSLGHALRRSFAVGMALGARIRKQNFRVCALLGDGECNEGQVWEAAWPGPSPPGRDHGDHRPQRLLPGRAVDESWGSSRSRINGARLAGGR